MRKILVFQNNDTLDWESLSAMHKYIQECVDNGVVVIDNRIGCETIEVDEVIIDK